MVRRAFLAMLLLCWAGAALGGTMMEYFEQGVARERTCSWIRPYSPACRPLPRPSNTRSPLPRHKP